MSLQIFRAKPNPIGKDKTPSGQSKPSQLLGEWVDIKNIGSLPIRFSTIKVYHTIYNQYCQTTGQTELYWFSHSQDSLGVGQVLRIHTGKKKDEHLISEIDSRGADWHGYADRDNFVLNNRCGDKIIITWQDSQGRTFRDEASYAPNQPEGVILKRVGNQLVVPALQATY